MFVFENRTVLSAGYSVYLFRMNILTRVVGFHSFRPKTIKSVGVKRCCFLFSSVHAGIIVSSVHYSTTRRLNCVSTMIFPSGAFPTKPKHLLTEIVGARKTSKRYYIRSGFGRKISNKSRQMQSSGRRHVTAVKNVRYFPFSISHRCKIENLLCAG